MNWIIDERGRARFTDQTGRWQIAAEPARPDAGLWIGRGDPPAAEDDAPPTTRLLPPAGQRFPPLAEVYSRGNDLVANLPQTPDTDFGLNLCYRVVRATAELVVCETIVAVQTDLLDSHPTLDLVCDSPGRPLSNFPAAPGESGGQLLSTAAVESRTTPPPPAATRCDAPQQHGGTTVILLPPSDRAAAADRSPQSPTPICYRLLAEFLEKGVIRKARYWTCRWAGETSDTAIGDLYEQLLHIPLPLTP